MEGICQRREAIEAEKWTRVHVPYGHLILFRGDLQHAGMSYKKENRRLFMYLHMPGLKGGVPPKGGVEIGVDTAFLAAVRKLV